MTHKRTTLFRLGAILVVTLLMASFAGVAGAATDYFSDDNGNIHEANINYIAELGITIGCNAAGTLFCPDGKLTRAEMATFLTRAFTLPATTKDYFTDDNGNGHEDNINRIAEAGITLGCTVDGTKYCPDAPVTRAEMATFIVRAMNLVPWSAYYFTDVPTTYPDHAANINAIAGHKITVGCSVDGKSFCPGDTVRWDEMASFLARALQLGVKRAPVATITSPPNLAVIVATFNSANGLYEKTVIFSSTVTDVNGGAIGATWRSTEPASAWLSGFGSPLGIGIGPTATLAIPPGRQSSQPTIQEYVSDSGGLFAMDQIQLKLVVPSP